MQQDCVDVSVALCIQEKSYHNQYWRFPAHYTESCTFHKQITRVYYGVQNGSGNLLFGVYLNFGGENRIFRNVKKKKKNTTDY